MLAVGKDTLYGSFTKPDAEEKTPFQQGANSIAWVMLRFIAVLIPFVFILLGITGGKVAAILRLCPVGGGGTDAGDAAHGHHRLSCAGQSLYEPQADHHQGHQRYAGLWQHGCTLHGQDRHADQREHSAGILHGRLGNESGEVLDLAFLNSIYHSGVRNPIDNAIRACQTMPGREVHFCAAPCWASKRRTRSPLTMPAKDRQHPCDRPKWGRIN